MNVIRCFEGILLQIMSRDVLLGPKYTLVVCCTFLAVGVDWLSVFVAKRLGYKLGAKAYRLREHEPSFAFVYG